MEQGRQDPIMCKALLCFAALLLGALLPTEPVAIGQDPTIRVRVQLVNILATVRDRVGTLAPELNQEDFIILDEGQPQEIRVFDRQAGTPLAVTLLVDSSGSTAKDLKFEQDSAAKFLHALVRKQDRVALYSFNQDVDEMVGFTNDPVRLERGLKDIHPAGGTSLYDAIFLAANELRRQQGRRVIILVTDGDDTTSRINYHQALHSAQDADAAIYSVIVVPILNEAGRDIGGEHALITLSGDTGGRAYQPRVASELDPAFADLARELRTQYLLGFYAQPLRDAKDYRRLEVKCKNPAFTVQARKGYYFRADRP
jgi:Ca-activated chloride channel family protein